MIQHPERREEKFKILLMKAIDGALTPEEKRDFERMLQTQPEYAQEWQQHARLKSLTRAMKFKEPPAEVWERYWHHIYNRLERGLAWILISIGLVAGMTLGAYHLVQVLLSEPELPWILKVGLGSFLAGVLALGFSVVREKWRMRKTDPYRYVKW